MTQMANKLCRNLRAMYRCINPSCAGREAR
jgi:hypothetical protein